MPITLDKMRDDVDEYVRHMMDDYVPSFYTSSKVVHDSIHGTNSFKEFEIAFIDLPIVQRLRRVSQTDVASHVFPSGNHNRFEHTLGTATVAGQLVSALSSSKFIDGNRIDIEHVCNHCRVAAILHDCGHGPFSHLSEQYYGDVVKKAVKGNLILESANPHEILSYLIATSKPLREFNDDVIRDKYGVHIDLEFAAEIIVGYVRDPNIAYIVEIVNGAFDSDKLDYIVRDSHSTGLKMSLDISRLFYTLGIQKSKYKVIDDTDDVEKVHLSVDISGVSTLEQIVFNKMLLTNTVYHHHKVRASGSLLKRAFELMCEYGLQPNGLDITNPISFLYFTDDTIFELFTFPTNAQEEKSGILFEELKIEGCQNELLFWHKKQLKTGAKNSKKYLV